ncbi:toprim domain-containing protein [Niveispirillum sp.]|uniref:DUF7146 domain-containing protein n=1 Tax=Niveispirillum sp. TaxID=1917217 RepID=UPI001B3CB297|nr:toprim domain-containing protein [Niveispirillum sp.]MBP7338819.1 toprim domain-containing protein [Niveispirillum sp.]
MSQGPTTQQISDLLRDRMAELPAVWGLAGEVRYQDFVCRSPFRDDRHAGSFRICIAGKCQGLIIDFAAQKRWSALSFTADYWFGGDMRQAVAWAKAWLGLDGTDPDAFRKTLAAKEARAERDAAQEAKVEQIRRRAMAIYLAAQERVIDTPVDAYLMGRGIDLLRLPFAERWFRGVRYHPALPCKELGTDEQGRPLHKLPAMVAAITADDGTFLSVHRTWLDHVDGQWVKADLIENKKSYGLFAGRNGLIRLWRGVKIDRETGQINRLPAWRDMRFPSEVHIAEGIENALSFAVEIPELRCVAGVSIDNMASIQWPEAIRTVGVWRDNDAKGSAADAALTQKVVPAYDAQGKRVVVPRPPEGVKDVNDVLKIARAHMRGRQEGQGVPA